LQENFHNAQKRRQGTEGLKKYSLFLWLGGSPTTPNQRRETVLKQEIHIALRLRLATGKVSLNEIVYRVQDLSGPLMLRILQTILVDYDDVSCERLSEECSSKERKGLGRHLLREAADQEDRLGVERHHRNQALQDDLAQKVFQRQKGALLERKTRHSWQLRYQHRLGRINTLPTLLNVTKDLATFKSVGKVHKG
jgi:hypothetical protein